MPYELTGHADVVNISHTLIVETSRGEGRAIALANMGNGLIYLVVLRDEDTKPLWFHESEVNAARLGT